MPRPSAQMRANARRALNLRDKAPASRKGMTAVDYSEQTNLQKEKMFPWPL